MDIRQFDSDHILEQLKKQRFIYVAVKGFEKKPQARLAEICYEAEGALYFACAKSETFYGELSLEPEVSLCTYDSESDILITLRGKAVFTEDRQIIDSCLSNSAILKSRWGSEPEMLIGWFLTNVEAEVSSLKTGETRKVALGTPDSVLVGITIKKDNEIRDRLIRIMERREAEEIKDEDHHLQKIYDGAVLYFAQTAKTV